MVPLITHDGELVEPLTAPAPAQLQLPPAVPSVSVIELPLHTAPAPEMASGEAFTVTVFNTVQPVPSE